MRQILVTLAIVTLSIGCKPRQDVSSQTRGLTPLDPEPGSLTEYKGVEFDLAKLHDESERFKMMTVLFGQANQGNYRAMGLVISYFLEHSYLRKARVQGRVAYAVGYEAFAETNGFLIETDGQFSLDEQKEKDALINFLAGRQELRANPWPLERLQTGENQETKPIMVDLRRGAQNIGDEIALRIVRRETGPGGGPPPVLDILLDISRKHSEPRPEPDIRQPQDEVSQVSDSLDNRDDLREDPALEAFRSIIHYAVTRD